MTLTHTTSYLEHALQQVKSGRRSSMPGIRHCPDCTHPFIPYDAQVPYCRDCRVNHSVRCRTCRTLFDCDTEGTVICKSCQNQETLF